MVGADTLRQLARSPTDMRPSRASNPTKRRSNSSGTFFMEKISFIILKEFYLISSQSEK
jgi:hypothetical protein